MGKHSPFSPYCRQPHLFNVADLVPQTDSQELEQSALKERILADARLQHVHNSPELGVLAATILYFGHLDPKDPDYQFAVEQSAAFVPGIFRQIDPTVALEYVETIRQASHEQPH